MSDAESPRGGGSGPGDIKRASKFGVAKATSTTEVASCSPNSTPFSPHFTCWWTISCRAQRAWAPPEDHRCRADHARDRADLPGLPIRAAVPALRALAARAPVPVPPRPAGLQPPAAQARARDLPADRLTWRAARRRSATGSGCWTPRRSRAAPRARRSSAPSWPAWPPTATAPATRATSGDCGCTSSARPTGCRSRSVWRPPTSPSARSPRRCSNAPPAASCCTATRSSSPTRASPAPSSSSSSPTRSAPNSSAPTASDERPRFGALGGIRQWIESINDTLKGQFSLERHGGHTPEGVWARVCQRVLALAAGCWHNWQIGQPGRSFTAYDH